VGSAVPARSRWFAAALVTVASIVLAHYAQVWTVVPSSLAPTSDFAGTYVAATLMRTGHAEQIYDPGVERRTLVASGAPVGHDDIPFENPPAAAVVALPFSLLSAGTAWRAWSVLQLLLMVLSLWIVARAAPWPAALQRLPRISTVLFALAGFGTGLLIVEGQWDGVSVLGVALAYAAWRRGRPGLAGFALGFTAAIAKPQLVIGIAAYMVGRRDWRAVAGALAGAALSLLIALLAVGPQGLAGFVSAVAFAAAGFLSAGLASADVASAVLASAALASASFAAGLRESCLISPMARRVRSALAPERRR